MPQAARSKEARISGQGWTGGVGGHTWLTTAPSKRGGKSIQFLTNLWWVTSNAVTPFWKNQPVANSPLRWSLENGRNWPLGLPLGSTGCNLDWLQPEINKLIWGN